MATERIVDLENQRYADREYTGSLPLSGSAREAARAAGQHAALAFLHGRVSGADAGPFNLTLADLASLLTVLGLDE